MNFDIERLDWKSNKHEPSLISFKNENSDREYIKLLSPEFIGVEKYPDLGQAYQSMIDRLVVGSDRFIFGFGSDQLLKDLFMVLDYESIQIFEHSWELATIYNKILNKKIHTNEFIFHGQFYRKFGPDTIGGDVLYIVNPHCPTGHRFSFENIKEFSEQFKYVIVDQVYTNPLELDHEITSLKNVILVKSFSKLGGVPGLRIGYCVADESIIKRLKVVKPAYELSSTSVRFIEYLLEHPYVIGLHIDEMRRCYTKLKTHTDGFSMMCGNFATFSEVNRFKGKKYTINGREFVRVTLTDEDNYKLLLNE